MLTSLSIRNVVLIDRLELEGASGLCALTGETGAGKSILLDALGLALGARADTSLVRHGAAEASVAACFDLPAKHPLIETLKEKGIDAAEGLILRRTLSKDGRGKAFINDSPVGVQLLKETGAALVEIHGQFATQGLLDPATHRAALDHYAGIPGDVAKIRAAWDAWQDTKAKLEQALHDVEALRLQEEYLKHTVAELEDLDPQPGEEDSLAEKRARLLNAGKIQSAARDAETLLDGENGILSLLGRLQSLLEKVDAKDVLEALARAKAETEDASYRLGKLAAGADTENLESIEDRYFALKAAAKKHRTTVDNLPAVYEDFAQKLRLITHQDDALADLEKAAADARKAYISLSEKASAARARAADKLAKAVQSELPDLKLDKAKFMVDCAKTDEAHWGPEGFDRVQFIVSTNPQTPPGPLHKIASGGELARFTLALKAVLAATGSVATLIFDEVDTGIGGAVADAVGERLARLAKKHQVLVVTHSPQVAARAAHHWHVAKTEQKGSRGPGGVDILITKITPLATIKDRQEEIARMLSGAKVTQEARAQAAKLLETAA